MSGLVPCCLTRDQANAFVHEHHRHHGPVTGHRFIVGALHDGELVGIAIAGRPVAQELDQYANLEVTRLCSDGSPNVCSFLYSRCARVARELGFATCFTAILLSESGASLKAAGWVFAYYGRGGARSRRGRPRKDAHPLEPKQVWCPLWCRNRVMDLCSDKRTPLARRVTA